jgi:predicted dehydrogenase
MYDWGAHIIEYALQVVDSDILEVTGFAHNGFWNKQVHWGKDTNEDEASATIRLKSGVVMRLVASSLDPNPRPGMIEFKGTKGTYILDHAEYELIQVKKGQAVSKKGQNPPTRWAAFYKNIAKHLVEGEKLVISAEYARRIIHILDLAGKSAKQGKTLKAKYN